MLLLALVAQPVRPAGQMAAAPAQQMFSFTHPAMGTTYSLFLYADTEEQAAAEADRAFNEVDDVEALLSNYQPQSELSRINRLAAREAVTTDPETLDFLARSLAWSARSDGAFDITVGALMKAWGFFRSAGRVPSPDELAAVRLKTGWQRVRLDDQARSVRFTSPGVELDPGGIGKGFAVDRVVRILRDDGVQAAMLSAGSSTIYALGAPPGQSGWRVEIPDPAGAPVQSPDQGPAQPADQQSGSTLSTLLLRDTSLSTASCAEKHFILAGHLYCHIMDPRLVRPVEGRLQATVIAPSATDSDALSNVVFVEDDQERAAFMRRADASIEALVVDGAPSVIPGQKSGSASSCLRYRWPAAVRAACNAIGAGQLGDRSAEPARPIAARSMKESQ